MQDFCVLLMILIFCSCYDPGRDEAETICTNFGSDPRIKLFSDVMITRRFSLVNVRLRNWNVPSAVVQNYGMADENLVILNEDTLSKAFANEDDFVEFKSELVSVLEFYSELDVRQVLGTGTLGTIDVYLSQDDLVTIVLDEKAAFKAWGDKLRNA